MPWPSRGSWVPNCFLLFSADFLSNLAPKTPLERRGSSCSAGCTKNQGGPGGAPEGPRRGPEGPGGPRRGSPPGGPRSPSGAPEGPRRGPPVVRHVEFGFFRFCLCVLQFLTVSKHVEVGSPPKEPLNFDGTPERNPDDAHWFITFKAHVPYH